MKKFTKLATTALFAVGAMATSFAQGSQLNLGSRCGCPAVNTRPVASVNSTFATTTANGVTEFTGNVVLTCDKVWTITGQLYVPAPYSITIQPGTVVQGVYNALPALTGTLIIERGAKIIADGTAECNIVFTTDQDPMDGTYSLTNVSKWGGIVICGIAPNNLTTAANNGSGLNNTIGVNGVGNSEGISPVVAATRFGAGDAAYPTADANDNSGVLRYVSLRHCGALLGGTSAGNEVNALSLYSVGAGTTIRNIEVIACGDDDIEYFGGTVNVKYIASFFGDDDKFDYDLGYSGKGQFLFSLAADSLNTGDLKSSDNGFECDADDQNGVTKTAFPFQSNPDLWNATFISNGKVMSSVDNTGHAGIQAKEMAAGRFHNCIFANFRSGIHIAEARGNSTRKGDAYDQWTNGTTTYQESWVASNGAKYPAKKSLIIQDNVVLRPNDNLHYGFTRGTLVSINATGGYNKDLAGVTPITIFSVGIPTAADSLQFFTTDRNQVVTSIPGFSTGLAFNGSNTDFTTKVKAIPSTDLISASTPANDGFFSTVNYKGAFSASEANCSWLSSNGTVMLESLTASNPTDINKDGVTNISDFSLLLGKYGQANK